MALKFCCFYCWGAYPATPTQISKQCVGSTPQKKKHAKLIKTAINDYLSSHGQLRCEAEMAKKRRSQ